MRIYSNDESDKQLRKRNFYINVYLFPLIVAVMICGLTYWASEHRYLDRHDAAYGYFMSLTPAFLLFAFNKRHWLKMPDGTYHNIKEIPPTPKINFNEPVVYEAEYFYSRKEKTETLVTGVLAIGFGIYIGFISRTTILIPISMNIMGLIFTYIGLKGLLDKQAKLKIAKTGLWTQKLGFVNWDDINFADVVVDKSGKAPQTYLEVRLKGTKFEEADQPDERLLLSDLKDHGSVEVVINNSIMNYNNQKQQY
jgi:hypothetical protein